MDQLWQHLPDSFKTDNRDLLLRAYMLASYAHRNTLRDSGEPYITHPIAVSEILTELRMDPEALAAGLLRSSPIFANSAQLRGGLTVRKVIGNNPLRDVMGELDDRACRDVDCAAFTV